MAYTEEDHTKIENPNLRAGLQYPRMVYHANGAHAVVADATEHKQRLKDGWQNDPIPLPEPEVVEPPTLGDVVLRLERIERQIANLTDLQGRLQEFLEPKRKAKVASEQAS